MKLNFSGNKYPGVPKNQGPNEIWDHFSYSLCIDRADYNSASRVHISRSECNVWVYFQHTEISSNQIITTIHEVWQPPPPHLHLWNLFLREAVIPHLSTVVGTMVEGVSKQFWAIIHLYPTPARALYKVRSMPKASGVGLENMPSRYRYPPCMSSYETSYTIGITIRGLLLG